MATMKNLSNNYSSNQYGESAGFRRADVLASCYVADSFGTVKGFHYCTTLANGTSSPPVLNGPSGIPEVPSLGLPSPPSSPPLAAISSSNTIALLPKNKTSSSGRKSSGRRVGGGATLIREDCERFFCETMRAVFYGEMKTALAGSGVMSVDMLTPPDDDYPPHHHQHHYSEHNRCQNDDQFPPLDPTQQKYNKRDDYLGVSPLSMMTAMDAIPTSRAPAISLPGSEIVSYIQIWDFQGSIGFNAFVVDDGEEKSLFAFFGDGAFGHDLKKTLVSLIELADESLECSNIVLCLDRSIDLDEKQALMKNLQWIGFQQTILDKWSMNRNVTSKEWLFMGMEV